MLFSFREFKYGLSNLHDWIRFFEMILHTAYKKETGKWEARSKGGKEKVSVTEKKIQTNFMNKMGFFIDSVYTHLLYISSIKL